MLATIVDLIMIAGFCWCIFCLLEYWFPVKINKPKFEHLMFVDVIAVNTSKRFGHPDDTIYHYVLKPEYDMPEFYYQTAIPKLDVGDKLLLQYRKYQC